MISHNALNNDEQVHDHSTKTDLQLNQTLYTAESQAEYANHYTTLRFSTLHVIRILHIYTPHCIYT